MQRGDYDYNHASSGFQFVALLTIVVLVIVCIMGLGGLLVSLVT